MAVDASLPRAFWQLIGARTLYTLAGQMQAVLIGWTVYATTHSAVALGLVGLAEAIPAIGLALFAGDAVDGGRPLIIYRRALWATTMSAGLLALTLHLSGLETQAAATKDGLAPPLLLLALYGASFVTGIARAYFVPCIFALVPRMVPNQLMPKSSAVMSVTMQTARVLGPAIGGIGYGLCGATVAIDAVLVLLILAQLSVLRMQAPTQAIKASQASTAKQRLGEGLRYVWQEPILLSALTLDMVSVLFGGVTAVLPIFAEEILHTGTIGLGLLRAAPAVGAACIAIVFVRLDVRPIAGPALLWSVAGFGGCMLAFGLSHNLYLSWTILMVSGILDGVSMMVRTLIVQMRSPDAMRGRIAAVNSMFVGSSNEIGELESGLAAAAMGLAPSVLFGGGMCLATVAATASLSKSLLRLNLAKS